MLNNPNEFTGSDLWPDFGIANILCMDPCSEYYLQGVNPLKSQRVKANSVCWVKWSIPGSFFTSTVTAGQWRHASHGCFCSLHTPLACFLEPCSGVQGICGGGLKWALCPSIKGPATLVCIVETFKVVFFCATGKGGDTGIRAVLEWRVGCGWDIRGIT